MGMKTKATLILAAILVVVGGLVYALMYGFGRNDHAITEAPLPSDAAALSYVTDHHLLKEIDTVKAARLGGPVFKMVQGKDDEGNLKLVWLTGTDKEIKDYGSALVKDGVPKETILAKAAEKGIPAEQLDDIFVAPYDYTSGRIVWFVRDKGIKKHMLWYDFKTGDPIWEAYEDPTAWTIRKG